MIDDVLNYARIAVSVSTRLKLFRVDVHVVGDVVLSLALEIYSAEQIRFIFISNINKQCVTLLQVSLMKLLCGCDNEWFSGLAAQLSF